MIADDNSPEPDFPPPSERCLFCKKEGVKGGGVGYVICDLFRFELMQLKAVQFEEYSMCFKCGSVINYVVYIKRLLLTTMFDLPALPPIFTRELPDIAKNFNENVRFILRCNIQDNSQSPIGPISSARKNGSKPSPQLRIQDQDDSREDTDPLLVETSSAFEEPANIGYHRYNEDSRTRAQSVPRTRSRMTSSASKRPRSQISRSRSQASQLVCKWQNCRLVCQSKRKLTIHYDEEHKFECFICNECSFGTRRILEKHKKENHDRICGLCELPIKPDEYRKHCKIEHNLQCPYCKLRFLKCKELTEHTRTKHVGSRIVERNVKAKIKDASKTTETVNSPVYEVIILNNNNHAQTPAACLDSLNLAADPLTESTTNLSNDTLSLNEGTIVQDKDAELCRTDSAVEIEQGICQTLEDIFYIGDRERVPIAMEMNLNNIELIVTNTTNHTSQIINEDLNENAPNNLRSKDISSEIPISLSTVPPILNSSSDLPPSDPPTSISPAPPILSTSNLATADLPTSVSPEPPVLSNIEYPSSVSAESPTLDYLGPVYVNTRRGRKRRLHSIGDEPPLPHLSPTRIDTGITLVPSTDGETSSSQEELNENRNLDQPFAQTKSVRGLKKRNTPSSPSIMNTRSRSRSHTVILPVLDHKNSNETIENDLVETSEALKDNTVAEVTAIPQAAKEKPGQITKSKHRNNREKGTDENQSLHNVNRTRSKRTAENLEDVHDILKVKSTDITVDQNVKVLINKGPVDAFSKEQEKNDLKPFTSIINCSKEQTSDVDPNNKISDVNTIVAKDENPSTPHKTPNNTTQDQTHVSDQSDQDCLQDKCERICNVPDFNDNPDNAKIKEKHENKEDREISEISNASGINIEEIVDVAEKCSDSSVNIQTVEVCKSQALDTCTITDNSYEDHDSNDSKSLIIHEEEVVPPVTGTNDSVSDQSQDCTQLNICSDTSTSNMDYIIETVVKAKDVISRPKGRIKKLVKSKNLKSEHSNSPSKASVSAGIKMLAGKSVKLADADSQTALLPSIAKLSKLTKLSNNSLSIRKNTKIPEDTIITKDPNTSSNLKSVAKYILLSSKVDASKALFKSKLIDTSPSKDDHSSIPMYTKHSANKRVNTLRSDAVDVIYDDPSTSFQKPNTKKVINFSDTDIHNTRVIDSLCKIKPKKRGRNNQKERSDRRATNFDEFISDREASVDVTTKTAHQPATSDRISRAKVDAYTFPETDSHNLGSSNQYTTGDFNVDIIKNVQGFTEKIDNIEPPIKRKKRVKSKPRRNTSFDNYINEASQRYYRNH